MAPWQVVSEPIRTRLRCLAKRPNRWGRQGAPSVTRASQDWVGENVTGEDSKSHIGGEVGVLGLINGGAAHPFRLAWWREGNGAWTPTTGVGPVTDTGGGGWGRQGGPPMTRASQDWVGENVTGEDSKSHIGGEVGGPGAYKRWRCTPLQASFWGRG